MEGIMKHIQISEELFCDLVLYHIYEMNEPEERIRKGLNEKMDSILRRAYFTQFKTDPDEKAREEARQKYLDHTGISPSFRW